MSLQHGSWFPQTEQSERDRERNREMELEKGGENEREGEERRGSHMVMTGSQKSHNHIGHILFIRSEVTLKGRRMRFHLLKGGVSRNLFMDII